MFWRRKYNISFLGYGNRYTCYFKKNKENEEDEEEDIQLHNAWVLNIVFSPEGSILVRREVEGYFGIWDPLNNKPKISKSTKAHRKWISSISFKFLNLYKDKKI